jgi:hypothetical protein
VGDTVADGAAQAADESPAGAERILAAGDGARGWNARDGPCAYISPCRATRRSACWRWRPHFLTGRYGAAPQ